MDMTANKLYNNVFMEVFAIEESMLGDNFSKEAVKDWDSVHQLNIVALVEELFNIMLDPEDIMGFTSYVVGKEILKKYDVDL